jgi:hypothetical protein
MSTTPPQHDPLCVAVLEIRNLSTAFVVADVCAKAGAASIVDIESNAAGGMAIKLVDSPTTATGSSVRRRSTMPSSAPMIIFCRSKTAKGKTT